MEAEINNISQLEEFIAENNISSQNYQDFKEDMSIVSFMFLCYEIELEDEASSLKSSIDNYYEAIMPFLKTNNKRFFLGEDVFSYLDLRFHDQEDYRHYAQDFVSLNLVDLSLEDKILIIKKLLKADKIKASLFEGDILLNNMTSELFQELDINIKNSSKVQTLVDIEDDEVREIYLEESTLSWNLYSQGAKKLDAWKEKLKNTVMGITKNIVANPKIRLAATCSLAIGALLGSSDAMASSESIEVFQDINKILDNAHEGDHLAKKISGNLTDFAQALGDALENVANEENLPEGCKVGTEIHSTDPNNLSFDVFVGDHKYHFENYDNTVGSRTHSFIAPLKDVEGCGDGFNEETARAVSDHINKHLANLKTQALDSYKENIEFFDKKISEMTQEINENGETKELKNQLLGFQEAKRKTMSWIKEF